jgi:hypothetical protein
MRISHDAGTGCSGDFSKWTGSGGSSERDEDTSGGDRDGSVDGRPGCGIATDVEVEGEVREKPTLASRKTAGDRSFSGN